MVVVVGLNSPNCSTSCETPKGIQCCNSFGCLTGSIIITRNGGKVGGRGWCNRILSSQLQFLESYKSMSKGKPCSIM